MNTRRAVFPRFFDPKAVGISLREVSVSMLRSEADDLKGRWFHSADEVDLFLWCDLSGKIVKQQLTFWDQVVEWNVLEGTKTGLISSGRLKSETRLAGETIQFDDAVQPQPLSLAMDVVRHAAALTESEQKEIVANFFRGQKNTRQNSDAFLSLYGRRQLTRVRWVAIVLEKLKRILRRLFKPS